MSRSVSAPSLVTKTSPCWNGFIVPGSTFRYGSSFCMVTRRPRALSRAPRLEAVRPLPREEATPPVTKMCLVVVDVGCIAKGGSRGRDREVRTGVPHGDFRRCRRCGSGASSTVGTTTGPRATRVTATNRGRFRPCLPPRRHKIITSVSRPTHSPVTDDGQLVDSRAEPPGASYPARTLAAELAGPAAPPQPAHPRKSSSVLLQRPLDQQ